MFAKKQLGVVAIALASVYGGAALADVTGGSTMTVGATLTTSCETTLTAGISFGSFAALESTGAKTADSGSTFQVACSNSATPTIYATGTRKMLNGANELAFNLSLTEGAASDDLPTTSGGAASFSLTKDGSMHDVVIYSKVAAAAFKGLPSGAYTADVSVIVKY